MTPPTQHITTTLIPQTATNTTTLPMNDHVLIATCHKQMSFYQREDRYELAINRLAMDVALLRLFIRHRTPEGTEEVSPLRDPRWHIMIRALQDHTRITKGI